MNEQSPHLTEERHMWKQYGNGSLSFELTGSGH